MQRGVHSAIWRAQGHRGEAPPSTSPKRPRPPAKFGWGGGGGGPFQERPLSLSRPCAFPDPIVNALPSTPVHTPLPGVCVCVCVLGEEGGGCHIIEEGLHGSRGGRSVEGGLCQKDV